MKKKKNERNQNRNKRNKKETKETKKKQKKEIYFFIEDRKICLFIFELKVLKDFRLQMCNHLRKEQEQAAATTFEFLN